MLIGRQEEQSRIAALLDDACQSRAALLRLVGDPGLGKTALLNDAEAAARARGMQVAALIALELEQDIPFAGLDILMLRLGADDEPRTPAGLLAALGRASSRNPLLLVVDDVQWLDDGTVAALSFSARRLAADPIAILLAGRRETDQLAALVPWPRLELAPLDDEDGARVLATVVPRVSAGAAARISNALHGVPLALHEAARILPESVLRGQDPLPTPLPVGEAIQARYARGFDDLDAACREALVLLAAAATTEPDVIAEALARGGRTLDVLAPAEDAGLVRLEPGPAFVHPLARAGVHSTATVAQRRHANRILADVLLSRGDERAALRHRAACTTPPDADLARDLEDLAEDLAGDPTTSSGAGEVALVAARFASDPEQRARLEILAAEHSDRERALVLARSVARTTTSPALRARATFVLVSHAAFPDPDQARTALAALEPLELPDAIRQQLDDMRTDLALEALDLAEARRIADRLEQQAARTTSWLSLATAGTALTFVGEHARAVPLLRAACDASRAIDPAQLPLEQVTTWATIPGWLREDDAEHADRFRVMNAVLRGRQQPLAVCTAAFFMAERARLEGAWQRAETLYREATDVSADAGQTASIAQVRLACLLAYQGREDDLLPLLDAARRPLHTWSPWAAGWIDQAVGALALTLGRPEQAVQVLGGIPERPFTGRGARDWITAGMVDLIAATAAVGDVAGACALTSDLAGRLDGVADPLGPALVARCRAVTAHDADVADTQFAIALHHHDRTVEVFERARTLLARGEHLRRSRRRKESREPLREALAAFDRIAAPPWSERARRELEAGGERIAVPRDSSVPTAALTPQEARVALAVADGLTNAQVAQQLFLSVKTVEFHLARVYRKLGVRSRGGLAKALAASGL